MHFMGNKVGWGRILGSVRVNWIRFTGGVGWIATTGDYMVTTSGSDSTEQRIKVG